MQHLNSSLWSYVFNDRDTVEENAYRAHYLSNDIQQITMIVSLAVVLMFCISLNDILKLEANPSLVEGLVIRSVLILLSILLVWLIRKIRQPWIVDINALIYSIVVASGIFWFHYTVDTSVLRMASMVIIFIYAIHLAFPTYAIYASFPVIMLMIADAYLLFTSSSTDYIENRNVVMIAYVASLGIAVMSSALLQRSRYNAFSALQEVKTLSGLLAICSSCKKVRDDQGFYQQIERYIQDRSDAEFTHGICPDCASKLYPDVFNAPTGGA